MVKFIAGPANERGYAVVAQDTRGKFRSEGQFMPFEGETLEWDIELAWNTRPLADIIPSTFAGQRSRVLDRLARLGPNDPFWTEATYLGRNPALGSSVAGLHFGGWWDIFTHGQLTDWALASRTSGHPHHLIMDAYNHYMGEWTLEPPGLPNFDLIPNAEMAALGAAAMEAPLDR
jgi:predicted acyl esterase